MKATAGSLVSSVMEATILVVEDEEVVRNLTVTILERGGFRVLSAESGTAALAIMDRHEGLIDLLLTDIVMPEMHGAKLAEIVRERSPQTGILLMSGYPADLLNRDGILPSGTSYIHKPFSPHQLVHQVREILLQAGNNGER